MARSTRWPVLCLAAMLAAALSACNGGAGSQSAVPSNTIPQTAQQMAPISVFDTDAPDALSAVNIAPGAVDGIDNLFHPHDGDMPGGGHGAPIGDAHCDTMEYLNHYHVHAYLGIVVKGKLVAIPDAIGLINPGPEDSGYITTAQCFYFIHTHDASGMIHIEDPRNLPPSASPYKLNEFLSIWGIKTSADNFGPFKGEMRVFVGNVSALGQTTVDSYTGFKNVADLRSIPLKSHEVIWVEIGAPFVRNSKLPPVTFYTEY